MELNWKENEKWEYDDSDFKNMTWDEVLLHAIAFPSEGDGILMDVDYVLGHKPPERDEDHHRFWIAPSTLAFRYAYDIYVELESYEAYMEIYGITRTTDKDFLDENGVSLPDWKWVVRLRNGEVRFSTPYFKIYLRAAPLVSSRKFLRRDERGGCSFYKGHIGMSEEGQTS